MVFLLILFFILGCAIGSFLNVVIDRTTGGKSILGRSYCDHCRATLSTVDLVPVLSFVSLRGRCRFCRKKISWQYPLVETLTGVLFVLTFYNLVLGADFSILKLAFYFFVIAIFIVVAVVDLKFSLIPTTLVYIGAACVLFYDYFTLSSDDFVRYVIVAFVLSAIFGLIVLVTRGRGMGTGDIPKIIQQLYFQNTFTKVSSGKSTLEWLLSMPGYKTQSLIG